MTRRESRLLGAILGGTAAFAIVNGLGYVISGNNPGYDSAQGAAGLYFMLSIPAAIVGLVVGGQRGLFLSRRKHRE